MEIKINGIQISSLPGTTYEQVASNGVMVVEVNNTTYKIPISELDKLVSTDPTVTTVEKAVIYLDKKYNILTNDIDTVAKEVNSLNTDVTKIESSVKTVDKNVKTLDKTVKDINTSAANWNTVPAVPPSLDENKEYCLKNNTWTEIKQTEVKLEDGILDFKNVILG